MREMYEVKLPRSRAPRFPDRCVVCDAEHPDSKLTLSAHAFAWWMAFVWWLAMLSWFKGFRCAIPACAGCARKFMRQYRMRFVIETVLVLAAVALSIYLVWDIPRPWQKWAGIGAALLILMPMFLWQTLWPMRVQIETDGLMVEYQFTDAVYSNEFKALNKPRPAMEGPFAAGPADETDEDARLLALFEQGRLDAMISHVENRLKGIKPVTPFHPIIGKDFLHQVEPAADWLAAFYNATAKQFRPAAIYAEMNRFDINFDQWHIEAMAHLEVPRGPMNEAEWDGDISGEFVLTGMEYIQKAMEEFRELSGQAESFEAIDQNLRDAQGDAFFLVMLHMQNLVKRAAMLCRQRGHAVGDIPVAANVHDETMVFTAQPDDEAAAGSTGGRSVPPAKYVCRPAWQVKYPHNWRAEVEDMYHDIDSRITVMGPGALVRVELYDESALHSPDEHTRDMAEIIWKREEVMPPTDVKARARKLVEELSIAKPLAKRFDHWGKYQGEGIRVTGRLESGPGSVAVFTGNAGSLSFVVTEICLDDKVARCSAGMELVRSTFRLGAPWSQCGSEA